MADQVDLYGELASWWPLVSDPADYAEEAGIFRAAIQELAGRPVRRVLELGCGGGNNASHLKRGWELVLTDRAPGMLEVSRRFNPECEHVLGDMRELRLGRTFDAVLVHDAVMYLVREEELRAAMETARAHLEPGGVALFVPDDTRETWRPETSHGGHDGGGRSLRYLSWTFDPDPEDTEFVSAYAFLVREGEGPLRCVRDEHRLGVFGRSTWLRLLAEAGFEPRARPFVHSSFGPGRGRELFLGSAE